MIFFDPGFIKISKNYYGYHIYHISCIMYVSADTGAISHWSAHKTIEDMIKTLPRQSFCSPDVMKKGRPRVKKPGNIVPFGMGKRGQLL